MTRRFPWMLLGILLFALGASLAPPARAAADVATAWRLLDYIAVDYAGAVADGKVVNEAEYAEQGEFAATVAEAIAALPAEPDGAVLRAGIAGLQAAIRDKADAAEVARLARTLGSELLQAHPVPVAPLRAPDLAHGAALYAESCASCHGADGGGDGPAAATLEVPPIAFTDRERARQRSLFALYQAISQGIEGTPMPAFPQLSSDERWALAFHVGALAFPAPEAARGEALWREEPALHRLVPDLRTLAAQNPADLEAQAGADKADALIAWLRHHPEALLPQAGNAPLALARQRLAASLDAARAGDAARARTLALSAYLDGFEPIEPTLATRNRALLAEVEAAMGAYRSALQRNLPPAELAARARAIEELLDRTEATLAGGPTSHLATFLGAATILLREGLEALLIVIAMLAFLGKTGRPELRRHVHAGWIGALVAGLLTWVAATWLIEISGASRELTEGFGSLLAAIVLVTVGIWMHGKAHADHWQRYIREKMSRALSGRAGWLLLALAFVVVYREVFETILFYAAMWSQGNGAAMLGGAASAAVLLALIAWLLLRFSARLPLGKFFGYSAALMAILAVILAGKGVAALQEAGLIDLSPLAGVPRIVALGIYPTLQGLFAQCATLLALVAGFLWNSRRSA